MTNSNTVVKNLKLIQNIIYNWSQVPENYPLIIRNAETGDTMDAWEVVLAKLNSSIKLLEQN